MVFLVIYTLHDRRVLDAFAAPPNYAAVEQAIKRIGPWMHIGGGGWFVESQMSSQQIAERLAPHTFLGDQILAFRVQRDWYGYGFTAEQDHWLKDRNFASIWEAVA